MQTRRPQIRQANLVGMLQQLDALSKLVTLTRRSLSPGNCSRRGSWERKLSSDATGTWVWVCVTGHWKLILQSYNRGLDTHVKYRHRLIKHLYPSSPIPPQYPTPMVRGFKLLVILFKLFSYSTKDPTHACQLRLDLSLCMQ